MKKIISIILAAMLLLGVCLIPVTSQASSNYNYSYLHCNTNAEYYSVGDTIELIISADDNWSNSYCEYPDNVSTVFTISYSNDYSSAISPWLQLESITDLTKGSLGAINYYPEIIGKKQKSYIIAFENDTSTASTHYTGDILKLTFKITEIPQETLTTYFNISIETCEFDLTVRTKSFSKSVKITSNKIGDINKDGKITQIDRIILSRYLIDMELGVSNYSVGAMDIDGDGKVTPADRLILSRYIANWKGYDNYFVKFSN